MHWNNNFQTIHSALLQASYLNNEIWKVNGRLQFRKYPNNQYTKIVTEEKFMFSNKKLSKSSGFYYLEPGLYPFITDFVESMNTLFQERHNQSESCITNEVSQRTENVQIFFADEGSCLAFFSTDLRHIFRKKLIMSLE